MMRQLLFFTLMCLFFNSEVRSNDHAEIKLVLQITVDGLRADLIEKYRKSYGEVGFNYLLKNGQVFTNAHYKHANTETIVGHTTLATGTIPALHGMVGNVWYDQKDGEIGYNIEDPNAPILPSRPDVRAGAQVDPAQLASRTSGRSPVAILTSTIADEIFKTSTGKSKVFGVSGKDRSAVAMAGHMGKAFWYSTDNGDFVTSSYYYQEYPEWVNAWNKRRKAEQLAGKAWELYHDLETYIHKDQDDRSYERDLKGYGKVFPHAFGQLNDPLLPTQILVSPYGDQLILDFALNLMDQEEVGQDTIIDYVSISFSSVDAVNHFFGPSSLENEDVVIQLDHTLSKLFESVDETIGLEHVIIAFSADHGMPEMPEYIAELGLKTGRIYSDEVVAKANEIGKKIFGVDGLVKSFFRPSLYVDREVTQQNGLEMEDVSSKIAEGLMDIEGIAYAVSSYDLQETDFHFVHQQIKNNYHPSRSGDVYVAQQPYWFLFEKGAVAAMHGSPWKYDTHVPVIIAAPGIEAGVSSRLVHPSDIAATIASLVGISPPSASLGSVLVE